CSNGPPSASSQGARRGFVSSAWITPGLLFIFEQRCIKFELYRPPARSQQRRKRGQTRKRKPRRKLCRCERPAAPPGRRDPSIHTSSGKKLGSVRDAN